MFVDPNSSAATWVKAHRNHAAAGLIRGSIASKPGVRWFGSWNVDLTSDIRQHVLSAAALDSVPVVVLYEEGMSECTSRPSTDGFAQDFFLSRVQALADGIGDFRIILVLQPWVLQNLSCVDDARERGLQVRAMAEATEILRSTAPKALVYLHGSTIGTDPGLTVEMLHEAGIADAHGFVLNMLGTAPGSALANEADALRDEMDGRFGYRKPYAFDTRVNGRPVAGDTCNSPDLRIGEPPRRGKPGEGPEYLLWLGNPGESAGDCGVGKGTRAGEFVPSLATIVAGGSL
ncbi:MAG: glycoside hydrolase family 6 protein [Phycicoccus sp.]